MAAVSFMQTPKTGNLLLQFNMESEVSLEGLDQTSLSYFVRQGCNGQDGWQPHSRNQKIYEIVYFAV